MGMTKRSICKHCSKLIAWLDYKSSEELLGSVIYPTPRWIHHINTSNWYTNCGGRIAAEPSDYEDVQKLLNEYYEDI